MIARAKDILGELERERSETAGGGDARAARDRPRPARPLPAGSTHPLLRELAALDLGAMTPLQALNLLADWQQRLRARP